MKKIILLISAIFFIATTNAQTSIFHELLQAHVDADGNVDYKAFKADEEKLDTYISYLEKTKPEKSWSSNKQKAFWINAYNAYTIKLILGKYPLNSIMKIKKKGKNAWNIPFAKVGGKVYTLDYIEHKLLRKKFPDPKIHVGVNCASGSCPKLSNVAFTEKNIDAELTKLMKVFINDASRNKLTKSKVQISKIFDWFKEDFTMDSSVIGFINKYSDVKIDEKAKVSFLEYDWSLNGK